MNKIPKILLLMLLAALLLSVSLSHAGPANSGNANVPRLANVTSISGGGEHSCAVKDGLGTLRCWGRNNNNQVGNAPTETDFLAVSAGEIHSCALRPTSIVTGTVTTNAACWGNNGDNRATPDAGAYIEIGAGSRHTCAIKSDHTLECWGHDGNGRVSDAPAGPFKGLTVGPAYSCAIRTTADADVNKFRCWGNRPTGVPDFSSSTYKQISAGNDFICAIRTDDTLICGGDNAPAGAPPDTGETFTHVAAGSDHACAIRSSGAIVCWGDNANGKTSPPPLDDPATVTTTPDPFINIDAGYHHTCAVRQSGKQVCWGLNDRGQVKPRVSAFTKASTDPVAETGGNVAINVTLEYPALSETRLPLSYAGAATAGQDYNITSLGVIVINENSSTGSVTLHAAGDIIVEGTEDADLSLAFVPWMEAEIIATVLNVDIDDDDDPIVEIDPVSFNGSETGETTHEYTISIPTRPRGSNNVVIDYIVTPEADAAYLCTVSPDGPISFNNGHPSQTMTVTVIDDSAVEADNHVCTIEHFVVQGSTDDLWDSLTFDPGTDVTINITDNDDASITVTESFDETLINEDLPSSDDFTIALSHQPFLEPVRIRIDPDPQCEVEGAGSGTAIERNFGWLDPLSRTFDVEAIDDGVSEGPHICVIVMSIVDVPAIGDWNVSITPSNTINARINDNDDPGVNVTSADGAPVVIEGVQTDTYTLELAASLQDANEEVRVIIDPGANCFVAEDSVTGSEINGTAIEVDFSHTDEEATIIIGSTADNMVETDETCDILHSIDNNHTSPNTWDDLVIDPVAAAIGDDDDPIVTLVESSLSTTAEEGQPSTDFYTLTLPKIPRVGDSVVINVTPGNQCDIGQGPGNPDTFTMTNTTTSVNISVTALEDEFVESLAAPDSHPCQITHAIDVLNSSALWSTVAINPLNVGIIDNDPPGFAIQHANSEIILTEGFTTDIYTITLTKLPRFVNGVSSQVVITVTPDNQCNIGAGQGDPLTFTFTNDAGNLSRQITLATWNDDAVEGPHHCDVTHTIDVAGSDSLWAGAQNRVLEAKIIDDDQPSVAVIETNATVATEGGSNDTYTLLLSTPPTGQVAVVITPDAQCGVGSGIGMPRTLIFTSLIQQTVTVQANDDLDPEGSHICLITHAIDSAQSDDLWDGISIANLEAKIVDNETSEIELTESNGSTQLVEGGQTDNYDITLKISPIADVVIIADPDSQCDVGAGPGAPLTLNFNSALMTRSIIVFAVNDQILETEQSCDITHTIDKLATDDAWDNVVVSNVTAQIDELSINGSILKNSGFEDPTMAPWKLVNKSKDKVKCNTTTPFGNGSPCAFLFKGIVGETARLQQVSTVSGTGVGAGTEILLKLDYRTSSANPRLVVKLNVIYGNGFNHLIKEKITQNSLAYTTFALPMYIVDAAQASNVVKAKVRLVNRATSGKIFIDNVDLTHQVVLPRELTLPLPRN